MLRLCPPPGTRPRFRCTRPRRARGYIIKLDHLFFPLRLSPSTISPGFRLSSISYPTKPLVPPLSPPRLSSSRALDRPSSLPRPRPIRLGLTSQCARRPAGLHVSARFAEGTYLRALYSVFMLVRLLIPFSFLHPAARSRARGRIFPFPFFNPFCPIYRGVPPSSSYPPRPP